MGAWISCETLPMVAMLMTVLSTKHEYDIVHTTTSHQRSTQPSDTQYASGR